MGARLIVTLTALAPLATLVFGTFACAADGNNDGRQGKSEEGERDAVVLVQLHRRQDVEAQSKTPPKLAPALVAVRDGGGVLKGADASANPVIAVTRAGVEAVRSSRAVRSVSEDVPADWQPVTRLTLNYDPDRPPDAADLENLGLRLVEDYGKGAFMVVEPVDRKIDAALADRLQRSAKVQYVAPSFKFRAIPPGKG